MKLFRKKNKKNLKLKDGIETYAEQLKALFGNDSGIAIIVEDLTDKVVKMTIPNANKAQCVAGILSRTSPMFGESSIPLFINEKKLDGYKKPDKITDKMVNTAFSSNSHFSQVQDGEWFTYIMFKPEVVYFRNDNLGSPYGVMTVSVESLAKELLDVPEYMVCTDYSK